MASTTDLPVLHRDTTDPAVFHRAAWAPNHNHARAPTPGSDRTPRAIVQATCTAHVVAAVQLAQSLQTRVSVRSGGHSWAQWSVRADAVLVDLGSFPGGKHNANPNDNEGLELDEATGVVACPPSTTGRILNNFLAQHGRMFAGGHCPDVGLGGFLLQGGMGWNCKNWGWACESVERLEAVAADGRVVYASRDENADLFWAARGAGPGFPAVVTRFWLRTRRLGEMAQSVYFYPVEEYRRVLQWVVDIAPTADSDTEIVALSQYVPFHTGPVIMANFLALNKPTRAAAVAALQPLHATAPPGALPQSFFAQPTSLPEQYAPQAAANPADHRNYAENAYVHDDADVPAVLERAFTELPTKESFALYFAMAPTSRRQGQQGQQKKMEDMALSMQTDHYFAVYAVWKEEREDERVVGWVKDVIKTVERSAKGSYLGDSDFQERRTKYWEDGNAARLRQIRNKWDPEGRICGYLDEGDRSGVDGLKNEYEWK